MDRCRCAGASRILAGHHQQALLAAASHASTHATGGADVLTPAAIGAVASSTSGLTGATALSNVVQITQAGYNAIATPSASTLYIIV